MDVLSLIVDLDGFQHKNDPFAVKCLAVTCNRTRSTFTKMFDTTALLTSASPAALQTYRRQTLHHGLALASSGLPQYMASTMVQHGINDIVLKLMERGEQPPKSIVIWVKGRSKNALVQSFLPSADFPCEIQIKILEDIGCPTASALNPRDPGPILTHEKAQLYADWLVQEGWDAPNRPRLLRKDF